MSLLAQQSMSPFETVFHVFTDATTILMATGVILLLLLLLVALLANPLRRRWHEWQWKRARKSRRRRDHDIPWRN
ncbi:hypothetical protein CA54_57130 [Symmachiella macrocystis]|uniref:Uncharacterized protein n=1 Tax=Symmachiella macrocystis TaxID=2527985 RepID=A0A5C6B6A6_9PLAN|nr:hypothetical protein CA54_57130 [Symmachiella macrocystis]